MGCTIDRTGAVSTFKAFCPSTPGCANFRSIAMRSPTVSLRGDSRSWGNVSQEGKCPTVSASIHEPKPCASSSASRAVAVTSRTTESERSEEHTSELQSRGHLVCRLLLVKKIELRKLVS